MELEWVSKDSVEPNLTTPPRKRLRSSSSSFRSSCHSDENNTQRRRLVSETPNHELHAKDTPTTTTTTRTTTPSLASCVKPAPVSTTITEQQQQKHQDETTRQASDDDDEVEVLWTLPPPSPARRHPTPSQTTVHNSSSSSGKKSAFPNEEAHNPRRRNPNFFASFFHQPTERTNPNDPSTETTTETTTTTTTTTTVTEQSREEDTDSLEQLKNDETKAFSAVSSSPCAPTTEQAVATTNHNDNHNNTTSSPPFRLVQSAYVQSLAEMAYTIQRDARWIVQDGTTLFGWDAGDDLTALLAFERLYRPSVHTKQQQPLSPRRRSWCSCLLCKKTDNKQPLSSHQDDPVNHTDPIEPDESQSGDDDDNQCSWLYLYCRLFNRRGPWFRLDDIYDRYYKPNTTESHIIDSVVDDDDDANLSMTTETNSKTPQPTNQRQSVVVGGGGNTSSKVLVFQRALLTVHLARVQDMFRDLERLASAGLMRSFQGQEECGRVVGRSVITQDMRTTLLDKLGVKQQKQQHSQNSNTANKNGRLNQQQQRQKENQVWKQMNRQQSIFATMSSTNNNSGFTKSQRLLPVFKHVNYIILEKLALDILRSCCGLPTAGGAHAGYVPNAIRKAHEPAIQQMLIKLIKRSGLGASASQTNTSNNCHTCWKLRESPSHCLRRCCRLYLCATGGPGEMRSEESNGWKSLLDTTTMASSGNFPLQNRIRPPGVETWGQVTYPGSMLRFGLTSAMFQRAYRPIAPESDNDAVACHVFSSRASFRAWEMCVELRAMVDYWIQLGHLMRYEMRRQQERKKENNNQEEEEEDDNSRGVDTEAFDSVDFMKILTNDGLDAILRTFLATFRIHPPEQSLDLIVSMRKNIRKNMEAFSSVDNFTEIENILFTLSIACIHLLRCRQGYMGGEEAKKMMSRPWLRHLCWEGCLAYILWDIIPILERRDLYTLAVEALTVLLYGSEEDYLQKGNTNLGKSNFLASVLLSRRARGKALERLVIDMGHIRQLKNKTENNNKALRKQASSDSAAEMAQFCEEAIRTFGPSSQITFSAVRAMARRLKRPLSVTLHTIVCQEVTHLGLRLGGKGEEDNDGKRYMDWTPITDKAIANALTSVQEGAGSRCVYVGHEDSSLNVEQLAMEYYRTGRLPDENDDDDDDSKIELKGGWAGWHDEGGFLRALFRILCSGPLLGADWGCCSNEINLLDDESGTIHLSPYQGAPFDLHVGFGMTVHECDSSDPTATPGFYSRRKHRIEKFLAELAKATREELCTAVYDAISSRLTYAIDTRQRDPALERDLLNLRTFSMIAAGCGGKLLSAIFRCFLFDYRHYSGGLPDLFLVRALVRDSEDGTPRHVDLSDWIGESFSSELQAEQEAIRGALMIADEEFLGCSKVGDSGNRSRCRTKLRSSSATAPRGGVLSLAGLPQKLELIYQGMVVEPECCMVEVKSSNDRLDGRQEDWLNILDQHGGNARVCKFEGTRSKKSQKQKIAESKGSS